MTMTLQMIIQWMSGLKELLGPLWIPWCVLLAAWSLAVTCRLAGHAMDAATAIARRHANGDQWKREDDSGKGGNDE